MDEPRSYARLLAPAALAAAMLAVIFVISSSVGGSEGNGGDEAPQARESTQGTERQRTSTSSTGRLPERTYIVKPGDNFDAISDKTGIPTDKLLELNPDLDPQALISGQRVRLR